MLRFLPFPLALTISLLACGPGDATQSASSSGETTSTTTASSSSSGAGGQGGSGGGAGGAAVCTPGAVEPCYTGPAGTADVGACKSGAKTCNATGSAFGPCTGQILPSLEDCSTPADESCNPGAPECGSYEWAKTFAVSDVGAKHVLVDAKGNVVVAGTLWFTANFGPTILTSLGNDDPFVAKLDPMGAPLWAMSFGSPTFDDAPQLALAPNGDVLIGLQFI